MNQMRKHLTLAVICSGYFMVILDAVIVNVALPSLGRELHGGITALQWVVDGYMVAFAGLLLDRRGAA
jgi:DHA2 family methylenomycin A resistance protein-like MFS transporter